MTRSDAKKLAKKILRSLVRTEARIRVREFVRNKVHMLIDAHRNNLLFGSGTFVGASAATNEIDLSRYENLGRLKWEEIPPVFRDIYPQQLIAGGVPAEFAQDIAKETAEASFNEDFVDTLKATYPEFTFTNLPPFGDEGYSIIPDDISGDSGDSGEEAVQTEPTTNEPDTDDNPDRDNEPLPYSPAPTDNEDEDDDDEDIFTLILWGLLS